jgi:hypothetical protein
MLIFKTLTSRQDCVLRECGPTMKMGRKGKWVRDSDLSPSLKDLQSITMLTSSRWSWSIKSSEFQDGPIHLAQEKGSTRSSGI